MGNLSDVKDLAIVGLVGYGIYWLSKNKPIQQYKETVKEAGYKTGVAVGSVQSKLQEEWYKTEFDAKQLFSDPVDFSLDVITNPERDLGAGTKVIGGGLFGTIFPRIKLITNLLPKSLLPNTNNVVKA